MTPLRRAFVVLLLAASCSWAEEPAPAVRPSPEQIQAVWDKTVTAFEKAEPVDRAVSDEDLVALSSASSDGLPRDAAARLEKLPVLVAQVRALQAAKTPKPPKCPKLKDKTDETSCVMSAVRSLADSFELKEPGRADQISALYLVRYNAPKDQTPEEAAKAQARLEKVFTDTHVPAGVGMRVKRVMGSADAFKNAMPGLDGAVGLGVDSGGASRGPLDQVLRETHAGGAVGLTTIRSGLVPNMRTPVRPAPVAAPAPGLLDRAGAWVDDKRTATSGWFKEHSRNLNGWADEQTDENGLAGAQKFAKKGAALTAGIAGHVLDRAPEWGAATVEFGRKVTVGSLEDKKDAAASVGGAVVHLGQGILDSGKAVGESWAAFNTDKTTTYQGLVATAQTVGFLGTFAIPAQGAAASVGAREAVAAAGARAASESSVAVSAAARTEGVASAARSVRPVRAVAVRDEGMVGSTLDLDYTAPAPARTQASTAANPVRQVEQASAVKANGATPEVLSRRSSLLMEKIDQEFDPNRLKTLKDQLVKTDKEWLVANGEATSVADIAEAQMRQARVKEFSPGGLKLKEDPQAIREAYIETGNRMNAYGERLVDLGGDSMIVEKTVQTGGRQVMGRQRRPVCTIYAACNLHADDMEKGLLTKKDVMRDAIELNPSVVARTNGGLQVADVPELVSATASRVGKVAVEVDPLNMARWMEETHQPLLVQIRSGGGLDGYGGHALVVGNPSVIYNKLTQTRRVYFETYDSNLAKGAHGYIEADTLYSLMKRDAVGVIPDGAEAGRYARVYESRAAQTLDFTAAP